MGRGVCGEMGKEGQVTWTLPGGEEKPSSGQTLRVGGDLRITRRAPTDHLTVSFSGPQTFYLGHEEDPDCPYLSPMASRGREGRLRKASRHQ